MRRVVSSSIASLSLCVLLLSSLAWARQAEGKRGGYGEKFERGIVGEWGGKDYQDVMSGVDAILKKCSWIDRDRLGVTGGSYGGYMTNWIVSHTNMQ